MAKKIRRFFNDLKVFGKTPEMASLFVILTVAALILAVNFFFVPFFLALLTVVAALGVAFAIINGFLKLAKLKGETYLKTLEFKAATENLNDGILIYDLNLRIMDLNRAAEEILGVKAEEIVGRNITPELLEVPRFQALTQVMFPSLAPSASQLSETEWPQIVRLELESPPLKLKTVSNRIHDKSGRAVGFIKVISDETRERGMVKSKSEFITVAAHQLRTPIGAIRWAFEALAKEADLKPELKETVENGLNISERMLKIVNDLLDAAKIEEGKYGFEFQETELNGFINQIFEHARPVALEYGVKLNFAAPPKVYKVKIDPERLGVAFTNFLDNAIRYNIKGGSVNVAAEKEEGRPFVRVSISDTGVGIPEEELKNLFTKFHRGRNVVELEPNGSGLGLYIVKNIVRSHGGEVGVESYVGRGSTFWFTLPLDPGLWPDTATGNK